MKVKVAGITDEQVVAYTWAANEVSWTLVSSVTAEVAGREVHPDAAGARRPWSSSNSSRIPNVPLPGFVLKRAVKGTVDSATKALRERVLKVKKGN